VDIDTNGVFVNGEQYDHKWFMKEYRYKFPFALLIVVAYLIMGSFFELWHPGWLIFLFIPIWYSFVEAIHKKNANIFAYPVVAVLLFLVIGFYWQAWHPGWVIFLSIPLYYSFIVYLKGMADERSKTGADDRVGYDNQTVNGDQVSKEDQAIDNDRADVDEK
jgi:asparagine N-glycosylation enzyme membrane subunit Stt3